MKLSAKFKRENPDARYLEGILNDLLKTSREKLAVNLRKIVEENGGMAHYLENPCHGSAKDMLVAALMEEIRQWGPPGTLPEVKCHGVGYAKRSLKAIRGFYARL